MLSPFSSEDSGGCTFRSRFPVASTTSIDIDFHDVDHFSSGQGLGGSLDIQSDSLYVQLGEPLTVIWELDCKGVREKGEVVGTMSKSTRGMNKSEGAKDWDA